ncbi:MAG: TPM domain-containing protein [Chitinophagaceae bacterium]
MNLFFWKKRKSLLSEEDNQLIVKAIRQAEKSTSGEVRVFIESRCAWVKAIDRAVEIFLTLKMDKTELRNGVIVYVAIKDRQLAVYGDEGIHKIVGNEYWNRVVGEMLDNFNRADYGKGIAECVIQIGDALKTHFPFNTDTDKNELPDEIVFGR